MNVTECETRLLYAAAAFIATNSDETRLALLDSAVDYGKAKTKARRNRDRWKARKRLGDK